VHKILISFTDGVHLSKFLDNKLNHRHTDILQRSTGVVSSIHIYLSLSENHV